MQIASTDISSTSRAKGVVVAMVLVGMWEWRQTAQNFNCVSRNVRKITAHLLQRFHIHRIVINKYQSSLIKAYGSANPNFSQSFRFGHRTIPSRSAVDQTPIRVLSIVGLDITFIRNWSSNYFDLDICRDGVAANTCFVIWFCYVHITPIFSLVDASAIYGLFSWSANQSTANISRSLLSNSEPVSGDGLQYGVTPSRLNHLWCLFIQTHVCVCKDDKILQE